MANERILVVEDNADARDLLIEWLDALGYPAAAAINGQDALSQLAGGLRPALVLLDLMMPVMDGWTFMNEAMKHNLLSRSEVWVVSAVQGMNAPSGIHGLISKPVDLNTLLPVVRRCCGKGNS